MTPKEFPITDFLIPNFRISFMIPEDIFVEILSYGIPDELSGKIPESLVMKAAARIIKGLPYRDSLFLLTSHDLSVEKMISENVPVLLKHQLKGQGDQLLFMSVGYCSQYDNAECLDVILPMMNVNGDIYWGMSSKLICVAAKYMKVNYRYLFRKSAEEGNADGIRLCLEYGSYPDIRDFCLKKAIRSGSIECVKLLLNRSVDDLVYLKPYADTLEMKQFLS